MMDEEIILSEANLRCPNPKCRRVMAKPSEVKYTTDLARVARDRRGLGLFHEFKCHICGTKVLIPKEE